MNVNETDFNCKKDTKKLKVVLIHNCSHIYCSFWNEFYIILILIVDIIGWNLSIFAIIKTISFVSDLEMMYNFSMNEWCYVILFSLSNINNKLFSYWIDKIFILKVIIKCWFLEFKDDTKVFLILNSCFAYSVANLQALTYNFTK